MPQTQVVRSANFAYDRQGRNLTLRALQGHLAENLRRCATPGARPELGGVTLQYVAGRGDWKHKAAWLAETRTYQNLRASDAVSLNVSVLL